MEVKQVKIGRVSNKAFLLFVVDAINSLYLKDNICRANTEESIDVDIVSETQVDLHYLRTDNRTVGKSISYKLKLSFTHEYDCVDIRIYLLGIINNGELMSIHIIKQIADLKALCDRMLVEMVELYQHHLSSLAPNIQNYENMACSVTDDGIYNGHLFDLLPPLEIGLYISAQPQSQQMQGTSRTYSNNDGGENESLGYTLGKLSTVVEKHWKIILAIVALVIFLLW